MQTTKHILELDNAGERMVPSTSHSSVFWAHLYRYQFATSFCIGKQVVDVACGEGYGSAGLKLAGASSILGIDISENAVNHVRLVHGVNAHVGDAQRMPVES